MTPEAANGLVRNIEMRFPKGKPTTLVKICRSIQHHTDESALEVFEEVMGRKDGRKYVYIELEALLKAFQKREQRAPERPLWLSNMPPGRVVTWTYTPVARASDRPPVTMIGVVDAKEARLLGHPPGRAPVPGNPQSCGRCWDVRALVGKSERPLELTVEDENDRRDVWLDWWVTGGCSSRDQLLVLGRERFETGLRAILSQKETLNRHELVQWAHYVEGRPWKEALESIGEDPVEDFLADLFKEEVQA